MSTPTSLTISLPPRFNNSYWTSPDYRIGVEELYSRLQQGIDEDASILALVQHRAESEYRHAELLATPTPTPDLDAPLFRGAVNSDRKGARTIAGIESNASYAFRVLEQETVREQANAHGKVARALERSILMPFSAWSREHRDRIRQSWEDVDTALLSHERLRADVARIRNQYEQKCQNADEAEDDARFIGQQQHLGPDSTSTSSSGATTEASTTGKSDETLASSARSVVASQKPQEQRAKPEKLDPDRLKRRETLRAQFGFRRSDIHEPALSEKSSIGQRSSSAEALAVQDLADSAASMNGSDSLHRGSTISHAFSSALSRASGTPAFQNLRAAVGNLNEPRHIRLRKEAELAERSYKDLVRQLDRSRCNLEDLLTDHFTMAERWESNRLIAIKRVLVSYKAALDTLVPALSTSLKRAASLEPPFDVEASLAQTIAKTRVGQYTPQAEVFQPYYHDDASSLTGAGIAGFGMDLVALIRAETLISENTDVIADGVRAGSGISKNGLPPIPLALAALLGSLERRYADDKVWLPQGAGGEENKPAPLVISEEKRKAWIYEVPLPNVHLCREAIISHLLGNSVPGANVGAGLEDKLRRFDAPTLASTVKLWALELADSLVPMRLWDPVVSTYQAAADQERDANRTSKAASNTVVDAVQQQDLTEDANTTATQSITNKGKAHAEGLDPVLASTIREEVLSDLGVILGRLPKIHLVCLDALIGHLARLIKSTKTEESDSLFISKVALSLSRALIRPSRETPATLRSLSPTLLAYDLITYYDTLLPKTLTAKGEQGEKLQDYQRKAPIRKRTKPVDQRISRSSLSKGAGLSSITSAGVVTEEPGETLTTEAEKPGKTAKDLVAPRLQTQEIQSQSRSASGEDQVVTPIATRILHTGTGDSTPRQQDSKLSSAPMLSTSSNATLSEPERALSPSTHSDNSAYGTADEDEEKPKVDNSATETASSETRIKRATKESTAPAADSAASTYDDDKPLTNVARLSRQFGKMGSSSGAGTAAATAATSINRGSRVRGPRPAN